MRKNYFYEIHTTDSQGNYWASTWDKNFTNKAKAIAEARSAWNCLCDSDQERLIIQVSKVEVGKWLEDGEPDDMIGHVIKEFSK